MQSLQQLNEIDTPGDKKQMNNGKIKIHWVRNDSKNLVANVLGYATHNTMMKKYCEPYFEFTDDAPIAINITPADHHINIPEKFNILFTMWESLNIPKSYIISLNKANLIIVPSNFCRDLFRQFTTRPIEMCWEGIKPDGFPFYQRKFPNIRNGERFRLLWLGAPNPRKGYYSILELVKVIEKIPHLELYIKTTAHQKSTPIEFIKTNLVRLKKIIKNRHNKKIIRGELSNMRLSFKVFFGRSVKDKFGAMGKYKNIFFDTRKLSEEELINLYNSAHCFISPHCGEGWGLTLCEAMATGCPCVATGATGVTEFFNDDVGYPIKYEIKETELLNYDIKTKMFIPDTEDMLNKISWVFNHYPEALKKGSRASDRIHNKFTWDKSALRLKEIIEKHYN